MVQILIFALEEQISLGCYTENEFEDFSKESDSRSELKALEPETSRSLEEDTTFGALIVLFEFVVASLYY